MTPSETLILAAYFFVLIVLAIYGWHRYYLVYLYMRNRGNGAKPGPALDPLPVVTIQLPLYNEMYVADRLIEAVCRIEYPREKLEIQVLDDSIDETRGIAELACSFATEGVGIKCCTGPTTSFKAGALDREHRRAGVHRDLRRRLHPTSDFLIGSCRISPIHASAWCRRAGVTSIRITRC